MHVKRNALRIRLAGGIRGGVLPLFVISAGWVARVSKLSAADSIDPVMVKKPGKLDAELNCPSCHDPYASKPERLLRKAAGAAGAAENLSLRHHCDFRHVNGGRQNVPALQAPYLGERL